jgi:hypothetical protein
MAYHIFTAQIEVSEGKVITREAKAQRNKDAKSYFETLGKVIDFNKGPSVYAGGHRG